MLVVYVPGSSFRLVDCSDCNRVLIVQGEAIKFVDSDIKISHMDTMFPIDSQHALSEGICFFDTVTNTAHRARLSRDPTVIVRMVARCDPKSLVCLFRIWARHVIGEEEVLTEIIRTVCARAISHEYADVWKEYLIGVGYRAVIECCTDSDILAQLPFSTRKRKQISREIKRDGPPSPHLRPDPISSPSLSDYGSLNPSLSRRPSHRRTTSLSGTSTSISPSVSVSVSQVSAQGEFQRSLSRSGSSSGTPPSPARKPVSLPARISGSPSAWRPVAIPSLPSFMPSVSHSTPLSWRSAVSTQSPPMGAESMPKEEQAGGYPKSPTATSSYFKSEIKRTPSGTKLDSFINIFFPHTVVEGEVDTGRVGGRGSFQSTSSARRLSPPRRRTTLPGPLPSADSLVKRIVEDDDEPTVRKRLTDALVEVVSDHVIARRGFGDTQSIRVRTIEAVNAYVQSQIQQANHLWNIIDNTRRVPRISEFSTCRCWNCGPANQHRRQQSSFTPSPFVLSHSPTSFSESPRKIDTTTVPHPPTLRKTVAAAMARQDSDEGMFYFEPSDIEDDEEPSRRETSMRRREIGAAVVLPVAAVTAMGIKPERQTWTKGTVLISREHLPYTAHCTIWDYLSRTGFILHSWYWGFILWQEGEFRFEEWTLGRARYMEISPIRPTRRVQPVHNFFVVVVVVVVLPMLLFFEVDRYLHATRRRDLRRVVGQGRHPVQDGVGS
ncbi:hypothetical protein BC937DRAFT_90715 [Endogone sp. FLAS-F59071]|nr:hypothetical protein BC937DRAFT_90715 [Endogone sp. FLAS-F59071]|eukprot:RUS21995.1 hypothetical protein BC937DRAFT_90715 [Endogone sp. FLAS-F59071]